MFEKKDAPAALAALTVLAAMAVVGYNHEDLVLAPDVPGTPSSKLTPQQFASRYHDTVLDEVVAHRDLIPNRSGLIENYGLISRLPQDTLIEVHQKYHHRLTSEGTGTPLPVEPEDRARLFDRSMNHLSKPDRVTSFRMFLSTSPTEFAKTAVCYRHQTGRDLTTDLVKAFGLPPTQPRS